MRYYEGPEPCPGCHKPGSEKKRELKTSICNDCKQTLVIGRQLVKDYGKQDYTRVSLQWYSLQVYPFLKDWGMKDKMKERSEKVDCSIRSLLQALNRPGIETKDYIEMTNTEATRASDNFVIKQEYAKELKNLSTALMEYQKELSDMIEKAEKNVSSKISAATKKANEILVSAQKVISDLITKERQKLYAKGVKDGKALLIQLNKGEITLADFDKELKL